jgi:hypothetical protein
LKRVALAVLALAIIVTMPVGAQTGVPVKNALVVVSPQDDVVLQSIFSTGGSPSSVQKMLKTAEELLSTSAPSASTDAAGRFTFSAFLSPGSYNVTVFAPGFAASSNNLAIDGSGAVKNLTIFMQPSAMVSGRVTDSKGKPIPGVVVAASNPHSTNFDITMDDGVFVLDTGLKTGLYNIYAFKPGVDVARLQSLLDNSTKLPMLENKVPGLFFKEAAGYISEDLQVQLEQGKLTTMNVQLEDSLVISGKVTDDVGSPIRDIAIFAFDSTGAMADAAAITGVDGGYTLNNDLAPGTYTIVIPSLFSKRYAPSSTTVTVPIENAVDFELEKSGTISGSVIDATGNPVEGATIVAAPEGLSTNNTQFLVASTTTAKTGQDGRFALDSGIGSDTYVVTASFGSLPVSSSVGIRVGSLANITLDFKDMITIKGTVTDGGGKPIENASVAPSFASTIQGAELFAVRTSSDGTYEMVVPLKDNSTRSLFDQVAVSASGYTSVVAQGNATIMLEKMPATKISGVVIAQKPLSPPVETVLTRKGTVIFEHEGAQYGVGLKTNTRVLAAEFDLPSKSISLDLEGVQDAAGRSEFSIPKEFMSGPFAVTLDGRLAESTSTSENQTHSTIVVEHEHDLQKITIQGATAVPEFPMPAILAAAGLAAMLAWKRLKS